MTLDKLDYVLTLAEERNFTRAAERLYISQPSLTTYIKRLEGELGVKLFERGRPPLEITPAGMLYIERMKKIQHEADCLTSELQQLNRKKTVFRFGIGSTRGNHWLPFLLPEFCRKHPDVWVDLQEKGEDFLEQGVLQGNLDLAVGVFGNTYSTLRYEPVAEERVLLAIPRTFPCVRSLDPGLTTPALPYLMDPERIGAIPFLLPHPGTGFFHCTTSLMKNAGLLPKREIRYDNMNTAVQLAAKGLGAIFLTPDLFLQRWPELAKDLAFCTLKNQPCVRRSMAVFQRKTPSFDLVWDMVSLIQSQIVPKVSGESSDHTEKERDRNENHLPGTGSSQ